METANVTAIPFVRLAEVEINKPSAGLLGHTHAVKLTALPVIKEKNHLWVAMSEPDNMKKIADLSDLTNCYIMPLCADEDDIRFYINEIFGEEAISTIASDFVVDKRLKDRVETPEFLAEISSAPAVRLIDSLIETGVLHRASDIHIEPFGRQLRTRYRVDGDLLTFNTVDLTLLPNIISRLKVMGGMDIAENRKPQDGHFTMETGGKNGKIDFRLSTLPTAFGEKAVIRLLYGQSVRLKKDELGFYADDVEKLTELFKRPYGAIIMTGPTGSGKSTTLNCFLNDLNHESKNIITVEDPVETPILGINHVNVERAAGLNFAGALKHILRQDPDVIMIGEIRDEETARIAVQAAITGHVVLTTLHTNDAAGVIERLADMGIEPYLTASALNGVISQRLVRRICADCAEQDKLSVNQARILGMEAGTPVMKGRGCGHCGFTGYRSRFAVYEYIIIDEKMRVRMSTAPARFAAHIRKKRGLRTTALRSMIEGKTTADEVIRVLSRDNIY